MDHDTETYNLCTCRQLHCIAKIRPIYIQNFELGLVTSKGMECKCCIGALEAHAKYFSLIIHELINVH